MGDTETVPGEHVVYTNRAPITIDVTCSRCWFIFRYEVDVTLVLAQMLADEGWSFPDATSQVCAGCQIQSR